MLEQAGGLYHQLAINIVNPSNTTYKRLYQNLTDGLWYVRSSNGTDELFTTSLGLLSNGSMHFQGGYDASTNLYPVIGGSGPAGVIEQGDTFAITVTGTLGGVIVNPGDLIIAETDAPGQVAANWTMLEMAGAYVPYTGANATVDLNTQSLYAGLFRLGIAAGSSILELANANAGSQLLIRDVNAAAFETIIIQLGTLGSLSSFTFSAPAWSVNKDLRFDTAGKANIYVNNGGNGISINGQNDTSGAFSITILNAGQLQLAASTAGSGVLVAGSAVIATAKITANSKICIIPTNSLGVGIAVGVIYESKVARVAGVSFTITSEDLLGNVVATDIRTFDWFFVEQ